MSIGKTTGKLNIAINAAELLALAAIAEIKVNVIEKPMLPSTIAVQYWGGDFVGFPTIKPIIKYVKPLISNKINIL